MTTHGRGESPHFYRVYGLEIATPLPFPELVEGGAGADVSVQFGRVDYRPDEPNKVRLVGGDVFIRFDGVGTFQLRNGREVRLDRVRQLDAALLRIVVTGPIVGLVLHQRRVFALHASTVDVAGAAVAFAGETGSGKSTIAAAFDAQGHPIVADDVLAVERVDGEFVAQAGYPQVKVAPDVVASLGGEVEALRPLHPKLEKRARLSHAPFSAAKRPLARIYSLATGPALEFEDLSGAEAAMELMRNAYVAQVPSLAREPWLLEAAAAVAEAVRVTRLTRPPVLDVLPSVVEAVRDNLAARVGRQL